VLFDGVGVAPDPVALDGASWGRDEVMEFEHRHLSCLAAAFLQGHRIVAPEEVHRGIRRGARAGATHRRP
jgi:hypothetical protein